MGSRNLANRCSSASRWRWFCSDHDIVRMGDSDLLEAEPDITVIGLRPADRHPNVLCSKLYQR